MTNTPFITERYFEYRMISEQKLEYRILIASPDDEPPPNGYAVIYALDGDALFSTLAEAVKLQTRKPKGYDPILVIGIGYPSREPFDMEGRCRDFTMTVSEASLPSRSVGKPWPTSGKANDFLNFIENELQPAIAKEWPVNPNKRAIVGHSLGGLFILHAMSTRPHLFSHYIAGSPSVWWGDNEVLKEIDRFKGTWKGKFPINLLLTIGAEELPDMLEGTEQVLKRMKNLVDSNIYTSYVQFAEEDHVSVLPAMLSRIPKFLS